MAILRSCHQDGKMVKFYRHLISKFIFAPSGEGDQRWKAYKFVKSVYDLWLPNHFKRICSAIDMLRADLTFEASDQPKLQSPDPDLESSRSGLSQQFEGYSMAHERVISDSQTTVQQVTPDTTVQTEQGNSMRNRRRP
ncbi:hypothetical protein GJ744_003974 [Endocarpon pusillum]|uniref:DUF7924 domain-containing protein n=1 Tax=Endocarpon pusillum TaxID=364733 RepID=A0A8H7AA15_9EURO|nr:hypothetical protein GJ744_003974 [Endocarpon pusillum]